MTACEHAAHKNTQKAPQSLQLLRAPVAPLASIQRDQRDNHKTTEWIQSMAEQWGPVFHLELKYEGTCNAYVLKAAMKYDAAD